MSDQNTVKTGWIGVDLDHTLAVYEDGMAEHHHIGAPVPMMVRRIKRWLKKGYTVKVFTARVNVLPSWDYEGARRAIQAWCLKHIGVVLEVTNLKDFHMIELWDDRAVRVERDTGKKLSTSLKLRD